MERSVLDPPQPPELPEGVAPRWPAWYAGVGFLVALIGTLIAVGVVAAATGAGSDDEDPAFTIIATLIQSLVFVGTAVLFASFTRRPKPWHFGLRRTPFWPALGWAALGMVSFYVIAAIYTALVSPDAEQTVAQDLGADEGTFGLIVAALMNGALFGVIHYDFSGADALLILPPLALLGFMFCLVFEKTGSLWPVVGLHAFNNAIAYGVAVEDASVSLVLGPLMLVACMLLPRLSAPVPVPRHAT